MNSHWKLFIVGRRFRYRAKGISPRHFRVRASEARAKSARFKLTLQKLIYIALILYIPLANDIIHNNHAHADIQRN